MNKFWRHHYGHLLFWAITVGFHVYTRLHLTEAGGWQIFVLEILVRNALLAAIIYTHILFLIPEFAQQKKIGAYLLGLTLCFGFYILLKNTHDAFQAAYLGQPGNGFWGYSFYNFSIALFYMAFAVALQLSKEWFFQRERLRALEVEKLQTELEYLKQQINPHFLFNSLNTIHFQIDKANTEARQTLVKFSDMLRFQLYECNAAEIPLEKEIEYLRNYIDLQRLRKDHRYQISFEVSGNPKGKAIAPMLFITLVENAFKHLSHHAQGGNEVTIELIMGEQQIEFRSRNTRRTKPVEPPGGIGLKNLQRRLELQYPEAFSLNIHDRHSHYETVLTIRK